MSDEQLTTQELQIVYQSNESVPINGLYEVVQNKPVERRVKETGPLPPYEPTSMHLVEGELFPNVEGRAVCWRLLHIDR